MSGRHVVEWTCDWCGAEAKSDREENLPPGWAKIFTDIVTCSDVPLFRHGSKSDVCGSACKEKALAAVDRARWAYAAVFGKRSPLYGQEVDELASEIAGELRDLNASG